MVQQVKSFQHSGGIYTRPDIPSATSKIWICHVCQKQVEPEEENYQILVGTQLIDKVRFIPSSRYWHGYTVGIEFCSVECSVKYHQENYDKK